jgi:tetratricopeptide (TPR) repeat protein
MTRHTCFWTVCLTTVFMVDFLSPIRAAETDRSALAAKAQQILKTNCYRCHGQEGAVEGGMNYVLDLKTLIARKKIVPGDPAKSRLFKRLVSTVSPMPPESEKVRPSKEDLATFKQWIEAGAPDFATATPSRVFLTEADLLTLIQDDLQALEPSLRRFARYFTITNLYNAGHSDDELQTYRHALSKLVNSLSWEAEIVVPKAVDPAQTVFRIDMRDYKWDAAMWKRVLEVYPYGVLSPSATAQAIRVATHCELPYVRADWLVFAASRPPLYHDILRLPKNDKDLERELKVDVAADIEQDRVARAGFNGSGVSRNNRLIERHRSTYGAYWKSYDFATNTGRQNLFAHPLGPGGAANHFQQDGGEIIFNLPNGLQAYFLVNGKGDRIDEGPTKIVSVKNKPDPTVINGVSCMSCHARGLIDKADQIRMHSAKNPSAFSDAEAQTVEALYPPETEFKALLQKDVDRFQNAAEATGVRLGDTEPVAALAGRFEAELDLTLAAAEVGLKPDDFLKGLGQTSPLAKRLGSLKVEGGTVQRQVFVDSFEELIALFHMGTSLTALNKALAGADEIIRQNPRNTLAYVDRGNVHFDKGDFDKAVADYTEAIRLGAKGTEVYRNRAMGHAGNGEYLEALADYNEAVRIDPKHAETFHNRGLTHARQGNVERAIQDLSEAIRLDPQSAAAYNDRGVLQSRHGDPDKAVADFTDALRLRPKWPEVHHRRGNAYERKGDYEKAAADYAETIRLSTKNARACNDLARLRAACSLELVRDGKQAVETATRACELTAWKNADYLATLAAAYAEAGLFERALELAERALNLASDEGKDEIRSQIALFKDRKPLRAK